MTLEVHEVWMLKLGYLNYRSSIVKFKILEQC